MSVLISKLQGRPKKVRLRRWIVAFFAIWASTSVVSAVASHMGGQSFPVAYLMVMCLMFTGFMLLMVATVRSERRKPTELVQSLELDGPMLTIVDPSPWTIDLTKANAYVLCLHRGNPNHASIRILRDGDEDDITIYTHAPQGSTVGLWISGDAKPPPGAWLGTLEYRAKFGAALLGLVRENKSKNRYWARLQELSETHLRHADDPAVVLLGDEDDDDALTYRSSGKPGPKEPGYGAWLESYGLKVSGGVFLSDQHLVAECDDGSRRAFPFGATALEREPGGLRITAGDDTYHVSLDDAAVAEAIVERLRTVGGVI